MVNDKAAEWDGMKSKKVAEHNGENKFIGIGER